MSFDLLSLLDYQFVWFCLFLNFHILSSNYTIPVVVLCTKIILPEVRWSESVVCLYYTFEIEETKWRHEKQFSACWQWCNTYLSYRQYFTYTNIHSLGTTELSRFLSHRISPHLHPIPCVTSRKFRLDLICLSRYHRFCKHVYTVLNYTLKDANI